MSRAVFVAMRCVGLLRALPFLLTFLAAGAAQALPLSGAFERSLPGLTPPGILALAAGHEERPPGGDGEPTLPPVAAGASALGISIGDAPGVRRTFPQRRGLDRLSSVVIAGIAAHHRRRATNWRAFVGQNERPRLDMLSLGIVGNAIVDRLMLDPLIEVLLTSSLVGGDPFSAVDTIAAPLPAPIILLMGGLAALGVCARRRKAARTGKCSSGGFSAPQARGPGRRRRAGVRRDAARRLRRAGWRPGTRRPSRGPAPAARHPHRSGGP